jgi:hypothetical protein
MVNIDVLPINHLLGVDGFSSHPPNFSFHIENWGKFSRNFFQCNFSFPQNFPLFLGGGKLFYLKKSS